MPSRITTHAAHAVHEWMTGTRERFARIAHVSSEDALRVLGPHLTAEDAVLVPSALAHLDEHTLATVFPIDGSPDAPGAQLAVAGHAIDVEDYISTSFTDPLGPTLVRLFDERDWSALLDDADTAMAHGVLPRAFTDRRLHVADEAALRRPFARTRITSIAEGAGGAFTFGIQGAVVDLAEIGDGACRHDAIAAFGGVIDEERRSADLRGRPWFARLLHACAIVKAMGDEPGALTVVGIGSELCDEPTEARRRDDDPILFQRQGELLLVDPLTRRRFRLDTRTASVVDRVQTSSTLALAAERIGAALGVRPSTAEHLRDEARRELGVHPGIPESEDARG